MGLRFHTRQFGDEFQGAIQVSIELTDKDKTVYWGAVSLSSPVFKANKQGNLPSGTITWEFEASSADMKRPKITGYSVEYGYEKDGEFVVLASEFDDVDSAQELADRNKKSKSIKVKAAKKKVEY